MTERILNDRYALESKVGEGGMAITYRARDLLLNRIVAVKLMREQFTADPQFVERFRREAQSAARLAHENIAGVYDTGRCNGSYYIVMEFVEGTDLKQRLRREGPLPVLTALEISRQIAAALDAAHRGGLVHRDIKPHNVLMNQEGKVKVTDFGIAKLASESEDTGVIIGSVHYISPEQARGEATTPSSDIYSLGAVMFEMLTGHTMFEAENAMAVAHKQIYDKPPLPRTLRPDIPPAVESMVMRCLEKDPRARYHSAAELQAVIAQLIGQLAQEATIVINPSAPSMDATIVIRTPASKPAAANSYLPRRTEPIEEPRRNGSGLGWLIGILALLLASVVGFGAYRLLQPVSNIPTPPGKTVAIPNLVGATKDVALQQLKTLNFDLKISEKSDFSDKVPEGQVFQQDPNEGTLRGAGAAVTIWISKGPAQFTMPDVANQTVADAKAAIRTSGYWSSKDFTVKPQSSSQPKGTVISTDPPASAVVKFDKKVTLVISGGEPPVCVYKGTIPSISGTDQVFYRVEIIRADGQPQEMISGYGSPGESIPKQEFSRGNDEKVLIRMLAGKDADSLTPQEEVTYPPGQSSGG